MSHSKLKEVITAWKEGNEAPFNQYYYRLYRSIMPKLKTLTQSKADAEDIFMEGLLTFFKKFFYEEQRIPDHVEGYFYRICYNIWYDYQHLLKKDSIKQSHLSRINNSLQNEASEAESSQEYYKNIAWTRALEKLSGNCKQIFEAHVEEGIKLKDLWSKMGFPSYQSLIQAYYRCKKKLTVLVFEELKKTSNTNLLK